MRRPAYCAIYVQGALVVSHGYKHADGGFPRQNVFCVAPPEVAVAGGGTPRVSTFVA